MMNATQIRDIIQGVIVAGDPETASHGKVETDTRRLSSDCIFWALKGERFDGNQFALQALVNGASIAVVDQWCNDLVPSGCVIKVPNALTALQQFARHHRQLFSGSVIAITGSNGKTSTKDLTAAVLAQKFRTHATFGNLNNHIGVPLTVLATPIDTEVAVYEMGMNHAGEIRPLAQLASPNCAIITNIGTAHIENLGSQQAIAAEKMSIAKGLSRDQVLWVGGDNAYVPWMRDQLECAVVSVGGKSDAIRAEDIRFSGDGTFFNLIVESCGEVDVRLAILGEHMVKNALYAVAAGRHHGMDLSEIVAGLESATLSHGRLNSRQHAGMTLLDDTYNANPESMLAALNTLVGMRCASSQQLVAVLGFMGEQGKWRHQAAQRIGQFAADHGISLIAVGAETEDYIVTGLDQFSRHFSDHMSAATYLREVLTPGSVVLFKGSRSAAMEKLMQLVF